MRSSMAYRMSQKTWVTDISPRVENILGFVEPYRDPYGVRAEWEGVICISDPDETSRLKELVDNSTRFIRMLPWAVPGENDGKGPFEANCFQAPNFTIVHALPGKLRIYLIDIRETCGLKNIVFANRMSANNNPSRPCHYVHPSDFKSFRGCNHVIRLIVTAIHELLGHGTGKLLTETASGTYNFERDNLPVNPLTGKAIETWYKPGQTWTIIYYAYLHVGVEGIMALHSFNAQDQTWGQPHARANFAILKHLLLDSDGAMTVEHDPAAKTVHVRIERSKMSSHLKPSWG
ncbi:putative dipeptidyl peptidase 3 [Trichoderma ghanense]|uniref:Dipeptidyl peptidase 3 n=1 Tax=Trichoderma ghanense TaxID=65468 RepID=A0ABY2GYD4_9HYPO